MRYSGGGGLWAIDISIVDVLPAFWCVPCSVYADEFFRSVWVL